MARIKHSQYVTAYICFVMWTHVASAATWIPQIKPAIGERAIVFAGEGALGEGAIAEGAIGEGAVAGGAKGQGAADARPAGSSSESGSSSGGISSEDPASNRPIGSDTESPPSSSESDGVGAEEIVDAAGEVINAANNILDLLSPETTTATTTNAAGQTNLTTITVAPVCTAFLQYKNITKGTSPVTALLCSNASATLYLENKPTSSYSYPTSPPFMANTGTLERTATRSTILIPFAIVWVAFMIYGA